MRHFAVRLRCGVTAISAVIFVAVSTPAQAGSLAQPTDDLDEKFSIPNQIDACRRALERHGWREAHEPLIVAGQSRTRYISLSDAQDAIPAIRQLLDLAERRVISLVVVPDINRYRVLAQQIEYTLAAYGCQMYSVAQPVDPLPPDVFLRQQNDAATIVHSVGALMSNLQISDLRRKFKANMPKRVTEKGLPFHKLPYGYRKPLGREADRNAVPESIPEVTVYLVKAKEMYLAGASASDVARYLNLAGVRPPQGGGQWQVSTTLRILCNPFYAGLVHHGDARSWTDPRTGKRMTKRGHMRVTAPGRHKALWSESDYLRMVERRKQVNTKQIGKTKNTHRFSRLVRNADTDVLLKAHLRARGKHARRSVRYVSSHAGSISEEVLIAEFRKVLAEMAPHLPAVEDTAPPDVAAQLEGLAHAHKALDEKNARYQRAYGDGVLGYSDFQLRLSEIATQRATLVQMQSEIEQTGRRAEQMRARRKNLLALVDAFDDWLLLDEVTANAQLSDLVEKILVRAHHVTGVILR